MSQTLIDSCVHLHADPERIAAVREALPDDDVVAALADTYKALGDPTRVRLLIALGRAELCVCDLAILVGMSESAVSHQLRLLRSLRLVRTRREGRRIFYRLDDAHIARLLTQGLEHVVEGNPGWSGR